MSDQTSKNLKASLSSLKVKEIQTRAQFCVNISMYFIDVSHLTECKFVATFCTSNHSVPCWFVERTWVSVKTWIIKHCLRFLKKIDVSGSIGPNKSLKMGKFSSAQASVKWRFVIDAQDIFGLFFSPPRFCFHACW